MEKYLLPNIYCEKVKKVKNYPDIIGKFWAEKNPPISEYRASYKGSRAAHFYLHCRDYHS